MIAAPIAAWLVKHLAARVLGVAAGGLIVLTNSKTIAEALGASGTAVAAIAAVVAVLWITGIVWAVRQERRSREIEQLEEQLARPEQTVEPRPGGSPRRAAFQLGDAFCSFGRVNGSTI